MFRPSLGQCLARTLALVCLSALPLLAGAVIDLPADTPAAVRWAAQDLSQALRDHGLRDSDARVSVHIGSASEPQDQGFSLRHDGDTIVIDGGGAAGAMYGVLELSEQLQAQTGKDWKTLAASIQPTQQQPWVAVRADNAFIHDQPLLTNDVGMWKQYIDMLARNRFNLLDLHGAYELDSTFFPNLYPRLVTLTDYPGVGDPQAQHRNLENLKTVVAYAADRGIRVALMNYSVAESHQAARNSARGTSPIAGVPADRLADYTAKATAELIRQIPQLYMLGFRVGETGQPASFFKDAYLKGVAMAGRPDLRLYTRSWLTTRQQLEPIADAAPGRFDIEIKYNGENLGLPYHAMQERFGTYSYEHYLDVPADYGIIWQVRANGTHRFWAWENTAFIRRAVRSFTLGHARGFTLEPPIAYFSVAPTAYYRSATDQSVHDYIWKKHWAWYFAWGRLGYNPDLPESTIVQAWTRHYGDAGAAIYQAMQSASQIVPLVYAYRFIGADHRDFAPETETGYTHNDSVVGSRTPIPLTLLQYAQDRPEDERNFIAIDEFVQKNMDHVPDGRLGPFAVAADLRSAATTTRDAMSRVPQLDGHAADEWRLLKTDLLAAADLGDYHASRIEGLTWIDHALRTNERGELDRGIALLKQSRRAWSDLAETTDSVYGPLENPLRHQHQYTWSSQLALLETLDSTAEGLWAQRPKGAHHNPLLQPATDDGSSAGLAVIDPPRHQLSATGQSMIFTVRASSEQALQRVVLWWKPLPSDAHWHPQTMVTDGNGGWRTEIPYTHEGLMTQVELQDIAGNARNFPREQEQTPWCIIDPVAPPAR